MKTERFVLVLMAFALVISFTGCDFRDGLVSSTPSANTSVISTTSIQVTSNVTASKPVTSQAATSQPRATSTVSKKPVTSAIPFLSNASYYIGILNQYFEVTIPKNAKVVKFTDKPVGGGRVCAAKLLMTKSDATAFQKVISNGFISGSKDDDIFSDKTSDDDVVWWDLPLKHTVYFDFFDVTSVDSDGDTRITSGQNFFYFTQASYGNNFIYFYRCY